MIQFTASAELHGKLEKAQQLLSHTVPSGDLAQLFERALDELIYQELKRRTGAGKPRKRRDLRPDSRHIPVEVARLVWERDAGQCTFVDAEGRRCKELRVLTYEHRHPFAFGSRMTRSSRTTTDRCPISASRHTRRKCSQNFTIRSPQLGVES